MADTWEQRVAKTSAAFRAARVALKAAEARRDELKRQFDAAQDQVRHLSDVEREARFAALEELEADTP